jgi:ArsR family transcriptional regulator
MNEQMNSQLVSKVAERLRALADENRLRLLMRLRERPANVTTLSEELEIGQASVSKHLGVLRQVGVVESHRQGTQAIYQVHDESIFELCDLVCDGVVRHLKQEHAAAGLGSTASNGRSGKSTSGKRGKRQQRSK